MDISGWRGGGQGCLLSYTYKRADCALPKCYFLCVKLPPIPKYINHGVCNEVAVYLYHKLYSDIRHPVIIVIITALIIS